LDLLGVNTGGKLLGKRGGTTIHEARQQTSLELENSVRVGLTEKKVGAKMNARKVVSYAISAAIRNGSEPAEE